VKRVFSLLAALLLTCFSLFAEKPAERLFGHFPLSFEPAGDRPSEFIAHGSGYSVRLSPAAVTIDGVTMHFAGAIANALATPLDLLPGQTNYLFGSDPQRWRTGVANYARIRFHNIYPGIDVVYFGREGKLEYDFIVQPGADPAAIRLAFERDVKPRVNSAGDLVTAALTHRRPVAYQDIDGVRRPIRAAYHARRDSVRFRTGAYDRSQPLVIDPTLVYSQVVGFANPSNFQFDSGEAIAIDSSGNSYVVGRTSRGFLTLPAPPSTTDGHFVMKLDPTGSTVLYTTYLSGVFVGMSIAVDAGGNAYLTGSVSSGLATTAGSFQPNFAGAPNVPTNNATCIVNAGDAFVTKLNPMGSGLVYSTYLGGSGCDAAGGIAVDSNGRAYVAGTTTSLDFPVKNAIQSTARGGACNVTGYPNSPCTDVFVSVLDSQGANLVFSTYLGGAGFDVANGIKLDASGNIYVVGSTASSDFPVTPGALQSQYPGVTACQQGHGFAAKLAPLGASLTYATYLGGSNCDGADAVAIDSSGNAYVAGATSSLDFPTTAGAFQSGMTSEPAPCIFFTIGGPAFVSKINATGSALVYSTYLGSSCAQPSAISLDSSGNAYVFGTTSSWDFPLLSPLQVILDAPCAQKFLSCRVVDFVTALNSTGQALVYSTELGDHGQGAAGGLAADASGNVYVTGTNTFGAASFFPRVGTQLQPYPSQNPGSIFIAKIAPGGTPATTYVPPNTLTVTQSGNAQTGAPDTALPVPLSYTVTDNSGQLVAASPTWVVTSGGGWIGLSNSATTGQYSANWLLGPAVGTQTVAAYGTSASGGTVVAIFTATAPAGTTTPSLNSGGVVNAAGYTFSPAAISPGSIVSVFGTNLSNAPPSGVSASYFVSQTLIGALDGTAVTFNGIPGPLFYVSPTQINVQVPFATSGLQTVRVQVLRAGVASAPLQVPVQSIAPGIFTAAANGTGAAAALNPDFSANSASNPIARGGVIAFFATGLDLKLINSQNFFSGAPISSSVLCATTPQVTIGAQPATIQYCGPAPGFVGLWQVNAQVPASIAAGQTQVAMTVGGQLANPVSIFVK